MSHLHRDELDRFYLHRGRRSPREALARALGCLAEASVPATITPGSVTVTGVVVALDPEAEVMVRGFSDPEGFPESVMTLEVQ